MNALKNIALFLAATVLALTGVELLLRTGWVEIRSLSDKSSAGAAGAGQARQGERPLRILILGDSFMVFGERNFGHALGERMNREKSRAEVQIVNLGLSGAGIDKYDQMYSVMGEAYRPDIVIAGIFIGNDLHDLYKSSRSPLASLKHEIASRFRTYWLLQDAYSRIRYSKGNLDGLYQRYRAILPRELQGSAASAVNPFLLELAAHYPDYFIDNLGAGGSYIEESFALAEGHLTAMNRRATSQGAKLIVVLIPDALQVGARYRGFYESIGFNMNLDFRQCTALQDRMVFLCGTIGIPCLDLLTRYRSDERDSLYLDTDTHWSKRGVERSAEITAEYLTSMFERH